MILKEDISAGECNALCGNPFPNQSEIFMNIMFCFFSRLVEGHVTALTTVIFIFHFSHLSLILFVQKMVSLFFSF